MEIEGGGREGERERRDKICINDRVSNLFEGRRSAKKLVDEIETKYVFRWGKLLCWSIEGEKVKLYRSFRRC